MIDILVSISILLTRDLFIYSTGVYPVLKNVTGIISVGGFCSKEKWISQENQIRF